MSKMSKIHTFKKYAFEIKNIKINAVEKLLVIKKQNTYVKIRL